MKSCPNCRVIHPDDFNGTCQECGAGLGGVAANGSPDLAFRYARQVADGRREAGQEQRLKRGDSSGVKLEDSLVGVASQFIVVDHEKLAKLEAEGA